MKRNKKAMIIRIISGIIALALIAGILLVASAFMGNPISIMIANRAAREYVRENYSFLDLELERAKYDFKSSNYFIKAHSKTSKDTHFSISYSSGEIVRDTYKNDVLDGFNTLFRLSKEYSVLAKEILEEELGYKDIHTSVMYAKENYENNNNIIKLDMDFDKTLPLDPEVSISTDLEDNSLENISKKLIDIHNAFLKNDCVFKEYSLYSENNKGKLVNINGVKPEDIESGELLQRLIRAKEKDEKERKNIEEKIDKGQPIDKDGEEEFHESRISVFIKEP